MPVREIAGIRTCRRATGRTRRDILLDAYELAAPLNDDAELTGSSEIRAAKDGCGNKNLVGLGMFRFDGADRRNRVGSHCQVDSTGR